MLLPAPVVTRDQSTRRSRSEQVSTATARGGAAAAGWAVKAAEQSAREKRQSQEGAEGGRARGMLELELVDFGREQEAGAVLKDGEEDEDGAVVVAGAEQAAAAARHAVRPT